MNERSGWGGQRESDSVGDLSMGEEEGLSEIITVQPEGARCSFGEEL